MDKNRIRLIDEGEQGTYILKPIPSVGKNLDQMPANEHLTMQKHCKRECIESIQITCDKAELKNNQINEVLNDLLSNSEKIQELIGASYLSDKIKRHYLLAYQTRIKKIKNIVKTTLHYSSGTNLTTLFCCGLSCIKYW